MTAAQLEPPNVPSHAHGGDELDLRLQAHHKALFTRIVMPVILGTTLFLVFSHWRFDDKFYSGLAVIVCLDVFNVYFSLRNRHVRTPWGTVESRSDGFDTFRWCINLPLDAYLVWSLELESAAMVAAWVILTFGALTEVYKKRNKLITVGVSLACYLILVIFLYPTEIKTQVYLVSCFCGMIFILWKLEVSLVKEMQRYFNERIHRERIQIEAEDVKRDAVIGNSMCSLTHELNNLTAIATLTTEQLRHSSGSDPETLDRLERSLDFMSKISGLVLDDLGGNRAIIRRYTLTQLRRDIRLLSGEKIFGGKTEIRFDFPESGDEVGFVERSGSTYLIVHNLVKNGREAIHEEFGDRAGGILRVASQVDHEQIILSVTDNGTGMSERQIEVLLEGNASTTKQTGHGLGMRFVLHECEENGYRLEAESKAGEGSRFAIHIPRDDSPKAST